MTARRKLREHMRQLSDIRDIMDAMKNLALLETHKLGNLLENQRILIQNLEEIAAEFLRFFPFPGASETQADCWILFGAERGFCGDFNDILLERLEAQFSEPSHRQILVAVGTKLQMKLSDDSRVASFVEGADVAEEIIPVLNQLIVQIGRLQAGQLSLNVNVVYHDAATERVELKHLMPPFARTKRPESQAGYPPLLNISPDAFYSALLDRYLFVALQEIAYTSLMAENQKRIQHMTGAVHHLDESAAELMRRYHMRRQEDITEEIEVILLNATREFD